MAQINFLQIEEEILKFWREKEIFNKSLSKKAPQGNFVFFEGPPTANGRPHIGHALTRFYKDAVLRYKTMQGFHVDRKAGWDTQGLPVELEVEKEIGISGKPDIEKFGIDKFNQKCRENVWKYKDEWEKMTERIGFWLDLKHPYVTYDSSYIETIWWILAKIWNKGLLYQDYKVVPCCPRCGTALSSHEVAQGYQNIEETSVYIKFKITNQENTYLLAWTTTPWTLPGNVALAINKGVDYVKISKDGEYWILAKSRLNVIDGDYKVVEEFLGEKLLNLDYQPLFDFIKPEKRAWFVIHGDFVSTEDGTGIVHIAPAFGEEDMEVGKKNDLPVLVTVELDGKMKNEIKPWAGMWVKDADPLIIKDLENRKILLKTEKIHHDYPFCWRCKTPLLYYAKLSWFIKVTDPQVKENLIKNSQTINWVPAHIKEGRFGEWLKNIRDWAISRERYWGTPLPIWECQKCKHRECVGSFEELAKKTNKNLGENFDPHRPQIDGLTWSCPDCGGEMKRVPEVLDCWFDSGSMPFAQWHYPFENVEKIDPSTGSEQANGQSYPADFISEAMDQTRGWFYSLLAISTLIDKGASYKNVICLDFVLDAAGEKMSKSKGNVVSWDAVNQYGADPIRWFLYTVNQSSESKSFDPAEIKKATQRMFLIFWNVFEFYNTYGLKVSDLAELKKSENIIDQWILTKFSLLIKETGQKMDKYDLTGATRAIEAFITDLSQWYLRRSRDRFADKQEEASQTLYYVLLNLTKLLAPFTPFCAEKLYLDLTQGKIKESVHLDDWPTVDEELIKQGEKLLEEMEIVRKICEISHNLRLKAKIKVRQPLKTLSIKIKPFINQGLIDLIKNEVNLKEINFVENLPQGDGWQTNEDSEIKLSLEINITPELKKEGLARELTRNINSLRKESGLTQKDQVDIYYQTSFVDLEEVMNDFADLLKEKTASKNIFKKIPEQSLIQKEFDIDGNKMSIALVLAEN
ncbi:MAG: isoleucine--tRNA ligase [Patescibacteria group bacterium]|nr:isoleucine--tRNA ligase [Patescibacteria group bacterium]